ncbi:putative eka-like protein [Erysiphe necator]|uniref:Putative eka-like protein n=1 Tax=Uncinula necator TaxID=52586 RepID=A0A0B1P7C4_UNCNE|nr:putative eka-like protein [Erysiphe necator]
MNCSRAPSCGNCGSSNHTKDNCLAATKCRNCGGPHRSDSRKCLARPTRSGAPTKEQMGIYRQAGDREYQAVLRARAAEENAVSIENMNAELTSSQLQENTKTTDNIQASHVEDSTRDARSLFNGNIFLNVYKAPHDPSAVQSLLDWKPTLKTIAIGDFNSVYWAWKPSANSYYGQGEEIERWAEKYNLTCLIVGEPTHRVGNTLDLVFTNISETMAWAGTEECMTNDHLPICGFVPNHKASSASLPTPKGKL